MRSNAGEAGFTLVELLVASAVAALVLGLLSAVTFQLLGATADGRDRLAVLRDHGNAFQWLNRDAQMAVSSQATVSPSSVTLNWTDDVSGITYQSSYAQSGDELVRTLTVDGAPTSQTVARNLGTSGFSVSLTGDLLTVGITSMKGDTTQTRTESVLMRASGAVLLAPLRLVTGTYAGDGSDGRQIAGLGFPPDVVFLKADDTRAGVIRSITMAGDAAKDVSTGGSLQANLIESLDADGFTIGSDNKVNKNGKDYYWVALKAGSDLSVGSYTGDASDDRSITGVGFQPVWVITMGDGQKAFFRPASLTGDNSYKMTVKVKKTNRIQTLEADGFQIGSNNEVNKSGTTFHYIAWAASSQVVQSVYTGDGNDDRSITGVGFQPEVVWVKRDDDKDSVWRPSSISGDETLFWKNEDAKDNRIQALESDGFQVGTKDDVKKNNKTYYFLALRDGGS